MMRIHEHRKMRTRKMQHPGIVSESDRTKIVYLMAGWGEVLQGVELREEAIFIGPYLS